MKSMEERQFSAWLYEALQHGIVSDIKYEPKSYPLSGRVSIPSVKKLKTKTKIVDKFLLHPHEYTPDFEFCINHTPLLNEFIKMENIDKITVDTKGSFNPHGGDRNFSVNRKWMMQRHGIYVNKIVPKKLFKKTWVPEAFRYSPKQKKPAKAFLGFRTISEYIEFSKGVKCQ